jgi:hypothetical protein
LTAWTDLVLLGPAIVVVIYFTLPSTEAPRATMGIELAKILAAGLAVGTLGVWARQALEGTAYR